MPRVNEARALWFRQQPLYAGFPRMGSGSNTRILQFDVFDKEEPWRRAPHARRIAVQPMSGCGALLTPSEVSGQLYM